MQRSARLGSLAVLAALMPVAGCGGDPGAEAERGADDAPAGAVIAPGLGWSTAVTGAGSSLTLADAEGMPLLRLACVRDPATMQLVVETFEPIGSEERLSFGVDDEPFVFVADPAAERASGVEAEAPIAVGLLDRLERANAVSAVYGAQRLGPHIPPEPEAARDFVRACRQIAGG